MGIGRMMKRLQGLAGSGGGIGLAILLTSTVAALAGEGQPSAWQHELQTPVTDVAEHIVWFHHIVNIVIICIAAFVLLLMLTIIIRFNERANPTPSRTTHNTTLEVLWTVVPVLILVGIAIPSFKLLYYQYSFPKPDLTIKATGNQWNWTHAYPDQGGFSFTSIMLTDEEREERIKRGIDAPRLLAVDNEVVVPVDKYVHVLVTASDVIHNWTIPSFGAKVDAVPGRVTATWFHAKKEGIFYGQCSELCGKDHSHMPIGVRVVKEAVFNQWVEAMKARDRKKARDVIEKAALEQQAARVAAAGGQRQVAQSAAATR
jgi:cytochrome c oxidase subunit II